MTLVTGSLLTRSQEENEMCIEIQSPSVYKKITLKTISFFLKSTCDTWTYLQIELFFSCKLLLHRLVSLPQNQWQTHKKWPKKFQDQNSVSVGFSYITATWLEWVKSFPGLNWLEKFDIFFPRGDTFFLYEQSPKISWVTDLSGVWPKYW